MALKESAQQEGVSTFTEIAAVFAILMHCYTEQDDIIIGTPAPAGRKRSQLQTMLGHFLNPVPLRFDFTGDPTLRDILHQTQRIILEALSNDEIPLHLIADPLKGDMDRSDNSFRTGISLQPPMAQVGRPWRVTSMDVDSGGSPWELYLAFIEGSDGMVARAQYNPDIFDRRTINSMFEDFQNVLEYIAVNKLYRLSDAKYLLAKSSAPASNKSVELCT
jgi:non-ribosomal peptide synthetase component F